MFINSFFNSNILDPKTNQIDYSNLFLGLFLMSLISTVFFLIFIFIFLNAFKWLMSFKNITTFKKIIISLLIGILISFLCPIIIVISKNLNQPNTIILQLVLLMVFSLFISTFSLIGMFPVFIISNIFLNYSTNVINIIVIVIIYGLIVINVFLNRFLFLQKIKFIFLTTFILYVFISVIGLIFFRNQDLIIFLINVASSLILFIFLYALALYASNFIDKAYGLKKSILYDNEYFANSGYSKDAFDNYIKNNNVQTGLLITFEILDTEKMLRIEGREVKNTIEKIFIKYIFQKFGKECFYFMTKYNKYSLFTSIDKDLINLKQSYDYNKHNKRLENDFLKKFEVILNNFPKKINYNNNEYDIQLVAFCSLYGVHSNNFFDLIKFNNTIKNNWMFYNDINVIKLFEFNSSTSYLDDKNNYINVDKKFHLNNISLSLVEQQAKNLSNKNNLIFYFPKIVWINENIYSVQKLLDKFQDSDLETILRNIAFRSLKLFSKASKLDTYNNENIVLIYPIKYFSSNEFNLLLFIKKIMSLGVDLNKIVIYFPNVKSQSINKKTISNYNKLTKHGIKFASNTILNNLKIKFNYLISI